jgi:hypothetical protein
MDQWMARSINLLTGREIIKMDIGYTVSPKNEATNYKMFCDRVKELAQHEYCETSPSAIDKIEMRLFSRGGRLKSPWRQFVSQYVGSGVTNISTSGYILIYKTEDGHRCCGPNIFNSMEEAEHARSARGGTVEIAGIVSLA